MMVDDKVIELFELYATGEAGGNWLSSVKPEKLGESSYKEHWEFDKLRDYEEARRHAAWMAEQAILIVKNAQRIDAMPGKSGRGDREKAHRWLGFIQATLWLCGAYTLDELKEHSRKCSDKPDQEETKR